MASNALSRAKSKRANNSNNNPSNNDNEINTQQNNSRSGLTLQSIIGTLNTRITKLEQNNNEIPMNNKNNISNNLDIEEINTRFDILVNEIAEIKDIILKLQTFTMEVNKNLYDERIQILSNDSHENINITDETATIDQIDISSNDI
jgi:TolA-binding protein